eukprot:Sdes_comp20462_c0_seq7m14700
MSSLKCYCVSFGTAACFPGDFELPQDKFLFGTSETISSSSFITDSAAGATAFSCNLRTNNGYVAVTSSQIPCGTIFEAGKLKGFKIGSVSTSRVTHATPAAFTAHVLDRNSEAKVAEQQIYSGNVDLLFGGGREYFVAQNDSLTPSRRKDDVNLIEAAQKLGFNYISTPQQLNAFDLDSSRLPILGLFSDSHMRYEIDRNDSTEPSLSLMTKRALDLLSQKSSRVSLDPFSVGDGVDADQGFMLLIEGSRIDMAAHANEPSTLAREISAFQAAFRVVVEFVEKNPETLVISTSDHDTGGLSIGMSVPHTYPNYEWNPSCLMNVTSSGEFILKHVLMPFLESNSIKSISDDQNDVSRKKLTEFLNKEIFEKYFHISSMKTNHATFTALLTSIQNLLQGFFFNCGPHWSRCECLRFGRSCLSGWRCEHAAKNPSASRFVLVLRVFWTSCF